MTVEMWMSSYSNSYDMAERETNIGMIDYLGPKKAKGVILYSITRYYMTPLLIWSSLLQYCYVSTPIKQWFWDVWWLNILSFLVRPRKDMIDKVISKKEAGRNTIDIWSWYKRQDTERCLEKWIWVERLLPSLDLPSANMDIWPIANTMNIVLPLIHVMGSIRIRCKRPLLDSGIVGFIRFL